MKTELRPSHEPKRRYGFTLVELLVVISIVILVSAVTLPTVLPALSNRQVHEAARILQASLAGARDAAVRANAPRGIRLIPDNSIPGAVTASRIIPIEPAPDLSEGFVKLPFGAPPISGVPPYAAWTNGGVGNDQPPYYPFPLNGNYTPPTAFKNTYPYFFLPPGPGILPTKNVLMVVQALFRDNTPPIYNPPTSWYWNVRIGDKLRFAGSGRYYTVVGPMTVANPELFVNDGPPDASPYGSTHSSLQETYLDPVGGGQINVYPEFLFLVNGEDDNNDGYVDNGFDGINQDFDFDSNGNPAPDDIGEWYLPLPGPASPGPEVESWVGTQATKARFGSAKDTFAYTIKRRPVPTAGSRETVLPGGATIDLTGWDSTAAQRERSRLPYDALNGYVDIMINQAGQVVPFTEFSSMASSPMTDAFYHFWISDRSDVYAPQGTVFPRLPMPEGTPGYTSTTFLKKDRQLVTLFTRTGQILTKSIETFDASATGDGANTPFIEAQMGIREAK